MLRVASGLITSAIRKFVIHVLAKYVQTLFLKPRVIEYKIYEIKGNNRITNENRKSNEFYKRLKYTKRVSD